jgi:H+/Cl- antiporter ClcA
VSGVEPAVSPPPRAQAGDGVTGRASDDGRHTTTSREIAASVRRELSDWQLWVTRGVVLAFAAAAGLVVVGFTWLSEKALAAFTHVTELAWWLPLLWMPAVAAAIVWLTRRFVPGAGGSGIPQVMASLETEVEASQRSIFVSLRLSAAKVALTAAGLLGGLSLGREGPSVQIAAGVMHAARKLLPQRTAVTPHGLLVAGGAAGIAAAFNTPLAGVMFAIEELSRTPEQRSSGLLLGGIVLAGLIAVSAHGNGTYFGVIQVPDIGWSLLLPGLLVAVACGIAGGLFSRLLIESLTGGADRFSRWRQRFPVRFAAGCGLAVALIGLSTGGATYGSGYDTTRFMLDGQAGTPMIYALLKFVATWLTTWSGVPGGIFAPCLSIGAGLGADIAVLLRYEHAPALIALGMAGFLAAVTQAPLTSFIIVMEMVNGHSMVLSLMACAMVASVVSKLISPPLYHSLAQLQLLRVPAKPAPSEGDRT